jgi:hypothetical protein
MTIKNIQLMCDYDGASKITIAKDRVTVKVNLFDPNQAFLQALPYRCAHIEVPQTGRGKLNQVNLDRGVIVLYTKSKNTGSMKVVGYLHVNEEPVRFSTVSET